MSERPGMWALLHLLMLAVYVPLVVWGGDRWLAGWAGSHEFAVVCVISSLYGFGWNAGRAAERDALAERCEASS